MLQLTVDDGQTYHHRSTVQRTGNVSIVRSLDNSGLSNKADLEHLYCSDNFPYRQLFKSSDPFGAEYE